MSEGINSINEAITTGSVFEEQEPTSELSQESKKTEELFHGELPNPSIKQAEIAKEELKQDISISSGLEAIQQNTDYENVNQELAQEKIETTEKPLSAELLDACDILYDVLYDDLEEHLEEAIKSMKQEQAEKESSLKILYDDLEERLEEAIKSMKQEQAEKENSLKKYPAVNLQKISYKDIKEKDSELVKKHLNNKEAVHSIRWDSSRNVVIIEKSGKFRAYKIGSGKHPALIESTKKSVVIEYLNRMS